VKLVRMELERPPCRRFAGRTLRAGAGVRAIEVRLPVPTAGYGPSGRLGRVQAAPCEARALAFAGAKGARAAVCVLDLMSASRYLHECIAARTAALGIGAGELLLAGTHTHTATSGFYGNALYDALAASRPGFRAPIAEAIVEAAAAAIAEAVERLEPCTIGAGETRLFGVARQASLAAFARNPESARWNERGFPGYGAPAQAPAEARAIDPRVRVLAAFDTDGRAIGLIATFGAHATALGADYAGLAPDWPGYARAAFTACDRGDRPATVVAVAASNAGDANVLRADLAQGEVLAHEVGERVAASIAVALEDARGRRRVVDLEMRFTEVDLRERAVPGRVGTELAPWAFGVGALAGGEDARSPLFAAGLVGASAPSDTWDPADPASPKRPALGSLQRLIVGALRLAPSPVWPLHALRLGGSWLVTAPGEPTAIAGHRIERAVLAATEADEVLVVGYAGDYAGYFTTPEEYGAQCYEGASTLFGRNSATHLAARLEALVKADAAPPLPRPAPFVTWA
jgi:neutral ceramidase